MSTPATKEAAAARLARTGLTPIGLDRQQAAAYVGVGATTFDGMVRDGRMPKPKRVGEAGCVWSVETLDKAFHELPDIDGVRPAHPAAAPAADDVYSRAEV
jgi:predicted DNA-binding transcriptional regulator AlpA